MLITRTQRPQPGRPPRARRARTWKPGSASDQPSRATVRPRPQRPLARAEAFQAEDAAFARAEQFATGNYR